MTMKMTVTDGIVWPLTVIVGIIMCNLQFVLPYSVAMTMCGNNNPMLVWYYYLLLLLLKPGVAGQ